MVWKIVKSGLVPLVLLSILLSCTRDQNIYSDSDADSSTSDGAGVINLNLATKSVSGFLGDQGQSLDMYLFSRGGNVDVFVQDVELTYVNTDATDNNIGYFTSESVSYGNYYMVLVAEYKDDEYPADDYFTFSEPVHGTPRVTLSSVMYTMPAEATKAMQFFYGIEKVTVDESTVDATVTMKRNQAKVSIRIKDTYDLMDHSDDNTVTVTLKGVPSTLDWNGKLVSEDGTVKTVDLKSQTTSTTSSWITETDNGTEVYVSESIVYIIPAHRNDDDNTYDGPNYAMTIEVKTTDNQGTEYSRTIELDPTTYENANPTANQQVLYNLIPTDGSVTVEASLLAWDVEDTQTVEISDPAALDCIVMGTNSSTDVSILDIYKEWNLEDGAFYNGDDYLMDRGTEVVATIISGDDCIKEAQVINRYEPDDWTHAVLWVESSRTTGSAVIGIKLSSDNSDTLPESVNGGYRWKWHVLVSDETGASCDDTYHATNASNANRSKDYDVND